MSELPCILVVDASRVVRATLAKHLSEHFAVIQDGSGESAWESLILNPAIVAVVAGVQADRLGGYGLLERIRENRLRRLKEMPFFLIASDSETEEGRAKAKSLGVSDFITKQMPKAEIVERIERHLPVSLSVQAGGGSKGEGSASDQAKSRAHELESELRAFAAILEKYPKELESRIGTVGLQVIPLLKAIDGHFRFGLPLPEMERRLAERARMEAVED